MSYKIQFTPEAPTDAELYEIARQKVANMLDQKDWLWLKCRIADEHLSWPSIFELVAEQL